MLSSHGQGAPAPLAEEPGAPCCHGLGLKHERRAKGSNWKAEQRKQLASRTWVAPQLCKLHSPLVPRELAVPADLEMPHLKGGSWPQMRCGHKWPVPGTAANERDSEGYPAAAHGVTLNS